MAGYSKTSSRHLKCPDGAFSVYCPSVFQIASPRSTTCHCFWSLTVWTLIVYTKGVVVTVTAERAGAIPSRRDCLCGTLNLNMHSCRNGFPDLIRGKDQKIQIIGSIQLECSSVRIFRSLPVRHHCKPKVSFISINSPVGLSVHKAD